jgi:phytoene dehydrogenase-like protein
MKTGRAWRAERRALLRVGAAAAGGTLAASLAACARRPFWAPPPVAVDLPGREIGHALRERWRRGAPSYSDWRAAESRSVDVAIVGGGVAGLGCAWRLQRAGHRDHLVLTGPEPLGNAAARRFAGLGCPTGSHYLPLPSLESTHVRELLAEMGVLRGAPGVAAPDYDERALVHAPSHRLLAAGRWEAGSIPPPGDEASRAQIERFLERIETLSGEHGADGRRAFVVPVAERSRNAPSAALDRLDAARWLRDEGFDAAPLRAWLEYCTRDEFGATPDEVSAWALVHYFAGRVGRARNAEPGAVFTWPDGLAPLARHLGADAQAAGRILPASIERIEHVGSGLRLFGWRHATGPDGEPGWPGRPIVLDARRVVLAAPLAIAARIVPELAGDAAPARRAPWTVANVVFRRPPDERETGGEDMLAWDNVVHGSPALGFVNAGHQRIGLDLGGPTVLSAYRVFAPADRAALAELARLVDAPGAPDARAWLALVGADLEQAYGPKVWRLAARVHVTVRGHGMAAPAPGFLTDARLLALRAAAGPLRFAHSDLSGYSVFEEALWWGVRAGDGVA